jgi:ornithine cyclodeaminase/alanine dehydrogenase-like protein (mu-crystallin family)
MDKFMILNKREVNELITVKDARLLMEDIIKRGKGSAVISHPPRMVLDLGNDQKDIYQFRAGYLKGPEKIGLRIANLRDNETRHVLLIDAQSSKPLGLVNESETFRLRIGGTVANIVKFLASSRSSRAALIGAGKVGRGICSGIDELGQITELRVFDQHEEARGSFVEELEKKIRLRIVAASSVQEAVENADIVVTATTANAPLVKREWVKKGCLVLSLGMGQELEPELVCRSDKIVVDDIELCKTIGDIAYLMNHGLLREEQIYANLYEIVRGIKRGRVNELETIVVVSQGMIAGDIALIDYVYEKALKMGCGRMIEL